MIYSGELNLHDVTEIRERVTKYLDENRAVHKILITMRDETGNTHGFEIKLFTDDTNLKIKRTKL